MRDSKAGNDGNKNADTVTNSDKWYERSRGLLWTLFSMEVADCLRHLKGYSEKVLQGLWFSEKKERHATITKALWNLQEPQIYDPRKHG